MDTFSNLTIWKAMNKIGTSSKGVQTQKPVCVDCVSVCTRGVQKIHGILSPSRREGSKINLNMSARKSMVLAIQRLLAISVHLENKPSRDN